MVGGRESEGVISHRGVPRMAGMHSHLLHYVIKLNGPGPNIAALSPIATSTLLFPISKSPGLLLLCGNLWRTL